MAEALLSVQGQGRFRTFSAGSQPTGRVNPFAVEQVAAIGYGRENLRSKSWDEFAVAHAPSMDLIITVCDSAAGEACPVWPGHPANGHWSFPDPAAVSGSDADKRAAFARVFSAIRRRVQRLVALPIETMDRATLAEALARIAAETRCDA
jgi:arsenate reductase